MAVLVVVVSFGQVRHFRFKIEIFLRLFRNERYTFVETENAIKIGAHRGKFRFKLH